MLLLQQPRSDNSRSNNRNISSQASLIFLFVLLASTIARGATAAALAADASDTTKILTVDGSTSSRVGSPNDAEAATRDAGYANEDHHEGIEPKEVSVDTKNDDKEPSSPSFYIRNDTSVLDYFNPAIKITDPDVISKMQASLQKGNLVVIRDAFIPEFAEHVWQDMHSEERLWTPFVSIKSNGHNFYKHRLENKTEIMYQTYDVFSHLESRLFFTMLSGRNCMSSKQFSALPSLYKSGDFSNLHTDRVSTRSVTFLWQLSKNWKPEYGGAFYWNNAQYYRNGYIHPSFNTLVLFSVTSNSTHGVTYVTNAADKDELNAKRLTFGGWYNSDVTELSSRSLYDIRTDKIEEWFTTKESQRKLTVQECQAILAINVDSDEYADIPVSRREAISKLQESVLYEGFGPYEENSIYTLDSVLEEDENQ